MPRSVGATDSLKFIHVVSLLLVSRIFSRRTIDLGNHLAPIIIRPTPDALTLLMYEWRDSLNVAVGPGENYAHA